MRASVGAVLGGWLKPSGPSWVTIAAISAERSRSNHTSPAHLSVFLLATPDRYIYEGNVVDVTSYMADDLHPGEP